MPEDWRNPADYEHLEGYSLHAWAWEFLRRNPKYRQAYGEWLKEGGETRLAPRIRDSLDSEASDRWGLEFPSDPAARYDQEWPIFSACPEVSSIVDTEALRPKPGEPWIGYPGKAYLVFDLRFPVETQLEIAAARLRDMHRQVAGIIPQVERQAKTFRTRQFPLYVRVLDAELAGATIGEMGRVLFPDRQDQRKNFKLVRNTARGMAEAGYRDLLLLSHGRGDEGVCRSIPGMGT